MRKIDAFAHVLPEPYFRRLFRHLERTMPARELAYYSEGVFDFDPALTNLDARWRRMEARSTRRGLTVMCRAGRMRIARR